MAKAFSEEYVQHGGGDAAQGNQDDGQQALPPGIRRPDQQEDNRRKGDDGCGKCAAARLFPHQQHHGEAQHAAGQAVQDGGEGAEQEAGKQHFGQHQQDAAFDVHQVHGIQQHRVGQPQLHAGNKAAEEGGKRDCAVHQAQDQRQGSQQTKAGDPLRLGSHRGPSCLFFVSCYYICFAGFRQPMTKMTIIEQQMFAYDQ